MNNFTRIDEQAGCSLLASFVESYLIGDSGRRSGDERAGRTTNWTTWSTICLRSTMRKFKSSMRTARLCSRTSLSASSPSSARRIRRRKSAAPCKAIQRQSKRILMDEDGMRKKVIAKPVGSGGKVFGAVYMVASMEDCTRR